MEVEEPDDARATAMTLSTREKLYVLFFCVRESGLYNMIMDAPKAAVTAECFGIYIGLLRFPSDFFGETMFKLIAVYRDWLLLDRTHPVRYAELDYLASQQPFMAGNLAHMPANQVVGVATYIMSWTGKEVFRRMVREVGAERARQRRDIEMQLVPEVSHFGEYQIDLRFGIVRFASFVAVESNRAALIDAVDREYNLVIDLKAVEAVQDFKAHLICSQCQVSFMHGVQEKVSGRAFCSVQCQSQCHQPSTDTRVIAYCNAAIEFIS